MSDARGDARDGELATDVEELVEVLEELREELRPRRGPFGLPAPPSPAELLRFADRQAIPFAIAVLEANVRALELLQGAIRLVESGRETGAEARRARDRAASLSRRSLERLDGVLSDLEASAADEEFDRPGEEIFSEARRLREEVEDALAARADETPDGGRDREADDPGDGPPVDGDDGQPAVDDEGRSAVDDQAQVDVEGELRTIKEELGKLDDAGPDGDERSGPDGDERPGSDAESDGDGQPGPNSEGDGDGTA